MIHNSPAIFVLCELDLREGTIGCFRIKILVYIDFKYSTHMRVLNIYVRHNLPIASYMTLEDTNYFRLAM